MRQELHQADNPEHKRIAAALGVFDGVHLGHRRVLAQAGSHGICHVVSFAAESMPEKQGHPVHYIYQDELKRRLLAACGAEAVFALPFGEIQEMDGESFCRRILRERIQADVAVCGEDYRFGRHASCGTEELKRYGSRYGFSVEVVPRVKDEQNIPVSSAHIRFLLESGQIQLANSLLGADYQIFSHVVQGRGIGQQIGIRTANQEFESWQCVPHYGVYASFAEINDIWIPAITNIGVRPTLQDHKTIPVAETHLLDWSGELTGTLLSVTLRRFLRPERQFSSLEELTRQIGRDIAERKRLLPAEGKLSP